MKKIALSCLLAASMPALAVENSLPENCEYGRSAPYDVEAEDVGAAIKTGIDVYGNPYSVAAWAKFLNALDSVFEGFDYLRYEGPKHVLQGQSFRAKGNLFDPFVNVKFHNSEKGYVGTDKSNYEANAYEYMSFDSTHGMGLAWVTNSGLCSTEAVWVQKQPEIKEGRAWLSNGKIYADVSYLVDQYSEAAKSSSTPVRISIMAFNEKYGGLSSSSTTTSVLEGDKVLSVSPGHGGGPYMVSVSVSDGNFSAGKVLGSVEVAGGPPPTCPSCPPIY